MNINTNLHSTSTQILKIMAELNVPTLEGIYLALFNWFKPQELAIYDVITFSSGGDKFLEEQMFGKSSTLLLRFSLESL